ncbi:DsbA family protein [Micromonospora maris]|uniref:Disulfide bond formation protein n=1 Tax=Micromonospora maris TaxID=1003110 RepID=A0A9X0LCP0_9ACTN|nr:DsbA family protein [Micromonospora maris]AEB46010.1 DSBA oxidoreductase [Micromonospora maris AB-18-032]KUJ45309.1 disulfide bond formation protein [Micromonospora maris]
MKRSRGDAGKTPPPIRKAAGWLGPVVVIAVVAVLAIIARPTDQPTAPAAGTAGSQQENPFAELARRAPGDPVALGEPDAPVVVIEYADFQCPFCGKHARETAPRLIREYVDRGLVRIEWRDLPYLGDESRAAASAARAAAAQGRFWEFHDALYAKQRRVNSGALNDAALRDIASRLGLDLARFDADRASAVTREAIDRDQREAASMGLTGTPAFIVGDTPIIGAQPYESFKQAIDEQLDAP